jgi:hypothetical protein
MASRPESVKFGSMIANHLNRTLQLLLLNATLAVLATGCTTHDERSYNQDFNQNLPTSPNYTIENVDDAHFRVTVHQGSPSPGTQRVIYVKEVASTVAATEAKRRGWQNWNLDYIQERDKGWMHIVIVDVTRKNPLTMSPGSTQ